MALVLLDAGVVGVLISAPRGQVAANDQEIIAVQSWFAASSGVSHEFAIVDVTRFEVRRDLVRVRATAKLGRLERLTQGTTTIATTREVWDEAAEQWANVRRLGQPTAADRTLDADAILAAAAILTMATLPASEAPIVATTNLKHLLRFGIDARDWRRIADTD